MHTGGWKLFCCMIEVALVYRPMKELSRQHSPRVSQDRKGHAFSLLEKMTNIFRQISVEGSERDCGFN
jgi:hypothetical protein